MSTLLPGSAHRRQLLRAAAFAGATTAALAAGGCGPATTGSTAAPATGPVTGSGVGPAVRTGDAGGDDADLLRAALASTDRALVDLRVAARRHPRLAGLLEPARRVHDGHRDVLADAAIGSGPAAVAGALPPTGGPDRALALLATREEATRSRLVDLAVRARSGAFARLLASAAAAVAAVTAARHTTLASGPAAPAAPAPEPLPAPLPAGAPLDGAATAVPALQDALAAEHAAVWTLGVLGARTSRAAEPSLADALLAAYTAHRERRDLLDALVGGLGEQPVVAAPTYELPRSGSVAAVTRAAAEVEDACGGWYAAMVAASVGSTRRLAATCLADTAIRGLAVRGSPEIFPGLGELADH